jgi:ferric-dicitrate binding protein FerR (iron transport regulator)
MMITEARLRSAPVRGAETPTAQPLVRKKRRAASALVIGIVAMLLLILGYMAIVLAVARIVTAVAASG